MMSGAAARCPVPGLPAAADGPRLVVQPSYLPHVASVAKHLAAGLYAPDVHVHPGWGSFESIRSPALRTTVGPIGMRQMTVRIRDMAPDTDIRTHVALLCAAPVIGTDSASDLHELMQAVAAIHADTDEIDMYCVTCPTPWSPLAVTIGVNDAERPVRAAMDERVCASVPMAFRADLYMDPDEDETVLTFQAQSIRISSFDLPDPIEAMRILAQHSGRAAR